jgi:hypothetical protein
MKIEATFLVKLGSYLYNRKQLAILNMKTIFALNLLLLCVLLPETGSAQLILLTGNIFNENTGNALENVNIFESNSGIGTITNLSGFYSLMLKPGNVEIVISHDGFQKFTKKLVLKNDTSMTVSLVPVFNHKSKSKETESQKTADKLETTKKH